MSDDDLTTAYMVGYEKGKDAARRASDAQVAGLREALTRIREIAEMSTPAMWDQGGPMHLLLTVIPSIAEDALAPAPQPATPLDVARLVTATTILVSVVRTTMPEHAPCGHDRRWLLSLLAGVEEAARLAEPRSEPVP